MRLIDADEAYDYLLKCKELKESEAFEGGITFDYGVTEGYRRSANYIKNMPTIDAVPVVRCKDCIFYEREAEGEEWGFCQCAEVKMPQIGFCSDAKRRKE